MTKPAYSPHDLENISKRTLDSYVQRAEGFWEGTRNHDVSENVSALLRNIAAPAPFTILDFGCGPGRDLITFTELGHLAIGLEAAAPFVAMARKQSGCEVWEQDFLALDLPDARFDGIFANASLFHVPTHGVLFSSNPHGNDDEGWSRGRFGAYLQLETWRAFMMSASFTELQHYYRPTGMPREQQPWLATVYRRS